MMCDILGSLAYFDHGPERVGMLLTQSADFQLLQSEAEKLWVDYSVQCDQLFENGICRDIPGLQYFHLGAEFKGYGVKTVGLVCERFIEHANCGPLSYVLGFQAVPPGIPGLDVKLSGYKVSMRVPVELWNLVQAGKKPNLVDILVPATQAVAGVVDACHPHAAATVIPTEAKENFLREIAGRLE
jgi:hypothetical protein